MAFLTSFDLAVTSESRFGDFGIDGIILSGNAGNGLLKHGDIRIASVSVQTASIAVEARSSVDISVSVSVERGFGG